MNTVDLTLYLKNSDFFKVFHQTTWKEGDSSKLESGVLSDRLSPHQVARAIHEKFSGNGLQRIILFVPQFIGDFPRECQSHQFEVYPSMLGKELQEYLSTLFPAGVQIGYAESASELEGIKMRGTA